MLLASVSSAGATRCFDGLGLELLVDECAHILADSDTIFTRQHFELIRMLCRHLEGDGSHRDRGSFHDGSKQKVLPT